MSEYSAPLKDIRFVMQELAGLEQVVALPGCEEATPDVVDAILEEAARFSSEVLSPLNRLGDTNGAKWKDKVVTTTPGFKEAYRQFVDNGWNGLGCDPEFGGQGLPRLLSTAVSEMWKASNHAFSLCPMLTQGAIEALMIAGTDEQKAAYLPNLVSGEWTGTMNLTEPSAGSDLAAVRTRAEPVGDGTFKIFGQKIFITYGEHDMTDNIVHLVLARTPTVLRKASRGFLCSSSPNSCSRQMARLVSATTPTASRSNTSLVSTAARQQFWLLVTTAGRLVPWLAKKIAAWNTCSS
jgi:alkylation response protein AidB-like acyl-CoA dehydrogenase